MSERENQVQQTGLEATLETLTTRRKRRDLLQRLTALLTAFVLLQTMVWIPQPAAAEASADWICGLEEHTHDENCYMLLTDHEETEAVTELVKVLACDFQPHKHTDDCYLDDELICGISTEYFHVHTGLCYEEDAEGNKTLVCTLKENPVHEHDDSCYTETKTLTCGIEEGVGAHKHDDSCYKTVKGSDPICGQSESEGHKHDESCYTDKLTCGKEETDGHQHSDSCYALWITCGIEQYAGAHHHDDSCYTVTTELVCDNTDPEHVHTEECYQTTRTLTCGKEETDGHQHTSDCESLVLVCGKEQGEGAHHHDASCYTKELTCGKTEGEGAHKHTDACYPDEKVLVCGKEASKGHKHSDDCYTIEKELTCKYAKVHEHTSACFEKVEVDEKTYKKCVCGYTEILSHKKHTDACLKEQEVVTPAHTHTDECFTEELICEIPEHAHTEACLATEEPTEVSTEEPEAEATEAPTEEPTAEPEATEEPVAEPIPEETEVPTEEPTAEPTEEPVVPVVTPEPVPATPTDLTEEPTEVPAEEPTTAPEAPIATPTDLDAEDVLSVSGEDYVIRLYAPAGTFPVNATLTAQELDANNYINDISERLEVLEDELEFLRVFDLTILDVNGAAFEPAAPVRVEIEMETAGDVIRILHYRNAQKQSFLQRLFTRAAAPAVDVIEPEIERNVLSFETESFSAYAIVGTKTISTRFITAGGEAYEITVTYGPEAEIPFGAELAVSELLEDNADYADYLQQTLQALDLTEDAAIIARMFDISIISREGEKVEPKAPVQVEIRLLGQTENEPVVEPVEEIEEPVEEPEDTATEPVEDVDVEIVETIDKSESGKPTASFNVVHFGDTTEVLTVETAQEDGAEVITFETESFSIYTVVKLDENSIPIDLNGYAQTFAIVASRQNDGQFQAMMSGENEFGQRQITLTDFNTYAPGLYDLWTFIAQPDGKYIIKKADENQYIGLGGYYPGGTNNRYLKLVDAQDAALFTLVKRASGEYVIYTEDDGKHWAIDKRNGSGYLLWDSIWGDGSDHLLDDPGNQLRLCKEEPNVSGDQFAIVATRQYNGQDEAMMANGQQQAIHLVNDYSFTSGIDQIDFWSFEKQTDGTYKIKISTEDQYLGIGDVIPNVAGLYEQKLVSADEAPDFTVEKLNGFYYIHTSFNGNTYAINKRGVAGYAFWQTTNFTEEGNRMRLCKEVSSISMGQYAVVATRQYDGQDQAMMANGGQRSITLTDNYTYASGTNNVDLWSFEQQTDGTYKIKISNRAEYIGFGAQNPANEHQYYLALVDEETAPGFVVEKWNGYYYIYYKDAETNKYWAIDKSGNGYVLWDCIRTWSDQATDIYDAGNQMRLCQEAPGTMAGQYVIVATRDNNQAMRYDNTQYFKSQTVTLLNHDTVSADTSANLIFTFEVQDNGTYKIRNNSGYLAVGDPQPRGVNPTTERGIRVVPNANEAARFTVEKFDGYYYIYTNVNGQNWVIDRVGGGYLLWNCMWDGRDYGIHDAGNQMRLCEIQSDKLGLDDQEYAVISTHGQRALLVDGNNGTKPSLQMLSVDFEKNTFLVEKDSAGNTFTEDITMWTFTWNRDKGAYILSTQADSGTVYLQYQTGDGERPVLTTAAANATPINVEPLENGCYALVAKADAPKNDRYLVRWAGDIKTETRDGHNYAPYQSMNIFSTDSCDCFVLCKPQEAIVEQYAIVNPFGYKFTNEEAVAFDNPDATTGPRTGASVLKTATSNLDGHEHSGADQDHLYGHTTFIWTTDGDGKTTIDYVYGEETLMWTFEPLGDNEYILSYFENNGDRFYLYLGPEGAITKNSIAFYGHEDQFKIKVEYDSAADRYTFSNNGYYLTLAVAGKEGDGLGYRYSAENSRYTGAKDYPDMTGNAHQQQFVLAVPGIEREPNASAVKVASDAFNGGVVVVYFVDEDMATKEQTYYAITKEGQPIRIVNMGDTVMYWENQAPDIYWVFSPQDETHYQFYNGAATLLPTSAGLISSNPYGAVMPGREDDKYDSKIANWDATTNRWYTVGFENGQFKSVELNDPRAVELRFATVPQDMPETVDTVDSVAKGIKIQMFDYPQQGSAYNRTTVLQNVLLSDWEYGVAHPGILETVMDSYPTVKNGQSLSTIFSPGSEYYKGDANHLFLLNEYNDTGYYHYRSWQNYAYYNMDGENKGDFTVYDAVAIPADWNQRPAFSHGNFMPFDKLEGAVVWKNNYHLFDAVGLQLPEDDPRFADDLRVLTTQDYFFGMSLSTNFNQPKNGLVNNEKNMTFEFNGDDDMWVFVDDVLLLDVGGIHDPRAGWIDFTTGVIYQQDYEGAPGNYHPGYTTIEQRFIDADKANAVDFVPATDENGNQYYLHPNGKVNTTQGSDGTALKRFSNYSNHTLNMYYLERGASASNLDIRFNLVTVNENEFNITKKIDADYQQAYGNQTFKMNAWVKRDQGTFVKLNANVNSKEGQHVENRGSTFTGWIEGPNGTQQAVPFNADGTFNLRADQTVVFHVTDQDNYTSKNQWMYYIEEVGVDPDYQVSVNDKPAQGIRQPDGTYIYTSDANSINVNSNLVVENKPKKLAELRIEKKINRTIDGGAGEPIPAELLPDETFEIQVLLENAKSTDRELAEFYVGPYYVVDAAGNYYSHTGDSYTKLSKKDIANYSSATGKIYGIREGYTIVIEDLLPGTRFRVTEIMDDKGTTIGDHEASVTNYTWESYAMDGVVNSSITDVGAGIMGETTGVDNYAPLVTITNAPFTRNITLRKVDDQGKALAGAKFSLSYLNDKNVVTLWRKNIEPTLVGSGQNQRAQAVIEKLPYNQIYILEETEAPYGYNALFAQIYFSVDKNGKVQLCDQRGNPATYENVELSSNGLILTVTNDEGSEFPSTGGSGTAIFYGLGILLMGLAAAMLVMEQKRKARGN